MARRTIENLREELKKKWKNLRDTYAKHLRSVNATPGQSTQLKLYKWQWAKQMETFRPFMSFAKTESNIADKEDNGGKPVTANIQINETSESTSSKTPQDELILDIEENVACPEPQEIQKHNNVYKSNSNKRTKRIVQTKSPTPTETVLTYLKEENYPHKNKTTDAIDLIFSGYATIVKTFSPRMQIKAKLQFAQLVAELEELQHDQEENEFESVSRHCF